MAYPLREREVGFTGPRDGMTTFQKERFVGIIIFLGGDTFHHGCCIGADEEAAFIAREQDFWIAGHPPTNRKYLSTFQNDEEFEPEEYLVRNKAIVNIADVMIATPGGTVEVLRSGTWATIRYAREAKRTLYTIFPDGRLDVLYPDGRLVRNA